ncbi:hypothetical protein PCL_09195 [Purpureocillium lilacinum]|uniref:Amino-acid N-acetyltransferase subunit Mak10 n=1 Tax=Purpureocillium lilacinum TaxID=33203 RepID=A0A2U3EHD0_PURLI|nr:hypothetical protein Purlil1_863 [Purpureocillium lilacinum]PWI73919.1 hypothetical protein PCL_09195 [Purpureocillium lilacinum]
MADYGIGATDEIARLSLGQDVAEPEPSPPPNITSPGIVAVDITQKFAQAAKTLAPGELVKDGFFTLFESVSALEIMDPKMDSGCVKPGDEFEELFDVSRALDPQEVLGVMDQLLCHEMSWHMGYPLAQTILTSVYVEALLMPVPSSIDQAYFVRHGKLDANRQPMLQEEDFVTNTYHRTLLINIPTSVIQQALAEAKGLLTSQRASIGEELTDALTSRLELRRIFLDAAECPQHVKDAAKARQPWEEAQAVLPKISATHALAKPVDEAFSAKLQRKLASTMPPRPIVELGFDDAFGHLSRLFADGLEVISILDYVDSQCLLTFVLTFQAKKPQPLVYVRTLLQTFLFNAMEILGSMSIRQLLDDDFSIISLPASVLLDRVNDEIEAVQDPRFAMSQQMEFFRQRAAQPFLDILRTACQNRSRVRRTLCHTIREWESLQVEAEEIDQILQVKTKEKPMVHQPSMSAPPVESYALSLSSWTYLYKLRQMEWIVQLGFELEVYQPDELGGMYWYLNYLSKSRLQHSERIKGFIVHKAEEARSQPQRPDPMADEQLQKSLAHTRLSLLDAAVTWELSDALCCLYTVLGRLDLVKPPPRPYSNDDLRYDLRMKPFVAVGFPALPNFHEFTAGVTQSESSSQELLEYAERAAAGAKRGYEALSKLSAKESFSVGSHTRWAASVKGALRSTIAAGIAISSVQKALSRQTSKGGPLGIKAEVPTPDKAYHEWWIVPKIVPVAP